MNWYFLYASSLILVSMVSADRNSSFSKAGFYSVVAISILFFGLRWNSGADYDGYLYIYDLLPTLGDFSRKSVEYIHGEIAFLLLSSAIKSLGVEDYLYMFILSFISLYLKAAFFSRESRFPIFVFSLYILVFGLTYEFVQVRYAVAIALVLMAISVRSDGKKYLAICFLLAATFIHYFSFFFIPVILVSRYIRFSHISLFIMFILLFQIVQIVNVVGILENVASQIDGGQIERRLTGYFDRGHYSQPVSIFSPVVVRYILLSAIVIFAARKIYPDKSTFNELVQLMLVLALASSMLSFNSILFSRSIVISEIIGLLLIVEVIGKVYEANIRFVLLSSCLLVYSLFFIQAVRSDSIYEYKTWLF